MWKIIETPFSLAQTIMDLDSALLSSLDTEGDPILHLYDWARPAATYGYFMDPMALLTNEGRSQLDLARRPTGGGLLFHTVDLAFSVLVPANHPGYSIDTLENYAFINRTVISAMTSFLPETASLLAKNPDPRAPGCEYFCMAKPTIFDVMLGEKKIAGAAQRRRKNGFLHQGSIAIALPAKEFLETVLLPEQVGVMMQQHTFSLLEYLGQKALAEVRAEIKDKLKQEFTKQ